MGRWKTCHKHMHMYQIECKQCMREERDALRAKLGTAEHERDDARTELDELRGMFDTLEQRRVSDAKQLAAQAPVIAAAKELIRVWGDGERYGETWCEMRHSYACYMRANVKLRARVDELESAIARLEAERPVDEQMYDAALRQISSWQPVVEAAVEYVSRSVTDDRLRFAVRDYLAATEQGATIKATVEAVEPGRFYYTGDDEPGGGE